MKSTTKIFAVLTAMVLAQATPAWANAAAIRVTVARDTPYRQAAAPQPVASASQTKFQIAPVKMQSATPSNTAPAAQPSVHPHWR
jgi:hypothetical protein